MLVIFFFGVDEFAVFEVGEFADALALWEWGELHVDVAACHFGILVDMSHGAEVVADAFGEFEADFLVSHLAAFELELDANFVAFVEEVFGVGEFDQIVVRVDADAEFEFFEFAAFLCFGGFFLFLSLFVFVFAVVDDFTDRRFSGG